MQSAPTLSLLLCCLLVIHQPVHPIRPRLSSVLPPIFLPGPRLALESTGSTHPMRPHVPRLGVCRSLFPLWPFMPPVVPYSVFVPPLAELLLDNPPRVVLLEVPCVRLGFEPTWYVSRCDLGNLASRLGNGNAY